MTRHNNIIRRLALSIAGAIALTSGGANAADRVISFEEILANPSDTQLNLNFARQEAKSGNLLQAAATMERLLMKEPGWDEARLFYAILLYRLDDPQAAEYELSLLSGRNLPEDMMRDVNSYRAKATRAIAPTRWSGYLLAGYRNDSDASQLFDDAFQFGGGTEDNSLVLGAGVSVRQQLSATSDTALIGRIVYYDRSYEEFENRSFSNLVAQAGLDGQLLGVDVTGLLEYRDVKFDGETYLQETGIRLKKALPMGERLTLLGQGYYFNQDFSDFTSTIVFGPGPNDNFQSTSFNQENRSGDRAGLEAGVSFDINPRNRLGAKVVLETKSADYDPYAYDLSGYILSYDLRIGKGAYLDLDYHNTSLTFDGADGFVVFGSTDDREDDRTYMRGAVGVPISSFMGGRGSDNPWLNPEKIKIELQATNESRESNFATYDYDNTSLEIRLVYGFGH